MTYVAPQEIFDIVRAMKRAFAIVIVVLLTLGLVGSLVLPAFY